MVKLFLLLCNIYWFFFFFYNRSAEVGDVDFILFYFFMLVKVITIRVPRVRYDSDTCRFEDFCVCLSSAPAPWPLAPLLPILSQFWPHSTNCLGIVPTCVVVFEHGPVPTKNWTEAIYSLSPALKRWKKSAINPLSPECYVFILSVWSLGKQVLSLGWFLKVSLRLPFQNKAPKVICHASILN